MRTNKLAYNHYYEGFSMMEQGVVARGPAIRTHLKQYMRRSFDMGGPFSGLDIKSVSLCA